jgi:hypothetical protein
MSTDERKNIELQSEEDTPWMNAIEAARHLRILRSDGTPCEESVRNLVSKGKVPSYKPFGRLLFKRSELDRLIESSKKGRA